MVRRAWFRLSRIGVAGQVCVASLLIGSPVQAQDGASAAFLLPACRLYLQSEVRGSRLRLERGVCLGSIETVLRSYRNLAAFAAFCPPPQVTLETAVRVVVEFAQGRQDLDRPLSELALDAYRQKWPC